MTTQRKCLRVLALLTLGLAMIGHGASVLASLETTLESRLAEAAIELLISELPLTAQEFKAVVLDTRIEPTSALVNVQLTTHGPMGTIVETIHVFAVHDGKAITAIFREPSPAFYDYAWQVSPNLLPRNRLLFWQHLYDTEHTRGVNSPDSDYKLPFTGGTTKYVSQNFDKHFDFTDDGWTARAARGGEALNQIDSYGAYYTRVTHFDGTYGWYIHFQTNSWFYGGQGSTYSVSQGDCLGITGSTGDVTGAHLHFNVSTTPNNAPGCDIKTGCNPPYWLAVSFTEGSIPPVGYTPYSQNSTAACVSSVCCGCLPASCCSTARAQASNLLTTTVSSEPGAFGSANLWESTAAVTCQTERAEGGAALAERDMESGTSGEAAFVGGEPAITAEAPPYEAIEVLTADAVPMDPLPNEALPLREAVEPERIPPTSANYSIVKSVFGSGGGTKTSTHYVINGTQGQTTDLSRRVSASYVLVPGYWGRWAPRTFEYVVYLPLVVESH